jgi:hypothetical protein
LGGYGQTAVTSGTLSYTGSSHSSQLYFPGGSVFADTIITYDELSGPPNWDDGVPYAGRAFHLNAYQNNILLSNFRLYETAEISLSYNLADLNGISEGSLTLIRIRLTANGVWIMVAGLLQQFYFDHFAGQKAAFVKRHFEQAVGVDQGIDKVAFAKDGCGLKALLPICQAGRDVIFTAALTGDILG